MEKYEHSFVFKRTELKEYMSKIHYQFKRFTISTGMEPWGGYFLLVEHKDREDGDFVFDNNWFKDPRISLQTVKTVLNDLDILLPYVIERRLIEHEEQNLGPENIWETFYCCDQCFEWSQNPNCCEEI